MKTELFVERKVTDPTAVTAQRTLKRLGFPIQGVRRLEHYSFEAPTDLFGRASACDVLVNVNKHQSHRSLEKESACAYVLIENIDGSESLRATLNRRFGFGIATLRTGILWELRFSLPATEQRLLAERAAKELLHNRHYQEFVIL
jgi:hypothetical protein